MTGSGTLTLSDNNSGAIGDVYVPTGTVKLTGNQLSTSFVEAKDIVITANSFSLIGDGTLPTTTTSTPTSTVTGTVRTNSTTVITSTVTNVSPGSTSYVTNASTSIIPGSTVTSTTSTNIALNQ